ncbi:arabinogalactan oligomer/maltooligosaccharide transport system permease protein [Anaeroplasma bactoclasticum]|jgi:arabinogalactan oligomer/maltooligosaccharide transport system permease protein|uniref:Arabinogalactan oligomer/maltooligosaccharide transport system permease protein n=2 Tax=Anaeroplasma bactoclasticum TaxID=2088 RepID=A0A397RUN6_9MOLU|nr:sugar ABC transporter permease [Anaeroplasma bactoclasticum]RIA75845.1 arabinogalactan oligomer/maltooligosaccharide transport system permease protein [Anaeroplasma bactoclasticum]
MATNIKAKPQEQKLHMKMSTKNRIINIVLYTVLVLMSIIWLFPFVGIVLESFRTESTWPVGYIWPESWGFKNYAALFENNIKSGKFVGFGRWYVNTLIIAVFTAVLQTLFVLMMAYTLSRLRFKGRKSLMRFMLILGMFPGFVSMIVTYTILDGWGLTLNNAMWGLILVYFASSGMGYYVSKGFFDTIPKSLDEAARVDGATRFQVFYKIILPLSKPIVIYTVLTAFMGPWGDFIFASYVSNYRTQGMTVAPGLQNYIKTPGGLNDRYTQFCAGGVLVAIPVTILFMCLQRYYVEGVTGGAVKG